MPTVTVALLVSTADYKFIFLFKRLYSMAQKREHIVWLLASLKCPNWFVWFLADSRSILFQILVLIVRNEVVPVDEWE